MSDTQRQRNLSDEHKELGDGLILRRANREDTEAVAQFNARVHYSPGGAFDQREPHQGIAAMTRDLMSGAHPACDAPDFTIVEDTRTGSVVSSACLIGQRFSYEGVEFDAGLPELVETRPDYRRRGLVGEQFEVLHRCSRERGHLMQAIRGIPYYYRRFGYEMAVQGGARRRMYATDVPGNPKTAKMTKNRADPTGSGQPSLRTRRFSRGRTAGRRSATS